MRPTFLLRSLTVFLACLFLCAVTPVQAQNMRVYTSVSDLSRGPEQGRAMSHSLTLFHAGKVYDYMDEVGEVVIFEPMHHRFIVLGKDGSATEVSFSELNQFLTAAEVESRNYINELTAKGDSAAARMAASIRFQLQPEFHEGFDAAANQLTLNGGSLNYSVRTAQVSSPELVRTYLEYADWAARLNYVLHPHSTYPSVRLKLNEALRHRELLPVQVDLNVHVQEPLRLRAEHSFAWEFQPIDRRQISHWEQTLSSPRTRWLTFHEYQQRLVAQSR